MSHLPLSTRNLVGYLIVASFFAMIFVAVWLTYGLLIAIGGGILVVALSALLIYAIDLMTEESHDHDRGPRAH